MSKLPPLNSVKAFEAAARLGSFVSAAAELGVTSVAIGQQVRNLETYFGKQLFSRHGNRIVLTDAGQSIYPQTSRALGELSAMSARIQERDQQALLVVSAPSSVADLWLPSKLVNFFACFPQMAIDIRVDEDPVDLAKLAIDIRISYGNFHYPELQKTSLFHDEVTPLCTPEFMVRHGINGTDLTKIHESAFIPIGARATCRTPPGPIGLHDLALSDTLTRHAGGAWAYPAWPFQWLAWDWASRLVRKNWPLRI